MSEANKELMKRWFEEVWNQRKLETINELASPDVIAWGQAGHGVQMKGASAFRAFAENLHRAFSDIRIKVEDVIAERDRVVVRWSVRMVHTGDDLGFPATNKTVELNGVSTVIIRNGKIIEGWDNWDQLGLLYQLGRVPNAMPFIMQSATTA